MADYIENFASKLDFAMPFQRTGKFPLDRTDLFSSYADAVKYAAGDTADPDSRALCGTSYVGQVITVFENDVVTVYKIGANRQLESIGGAYTLPKASATELGGIKVGAGLNISEEGTLSATGGGTADAVEWANVIDKPTKLSQFTNDLEFIDKTVSNLVNYYDKTSVDQMIGQIATLSVQKVDSLPVENIKTNATGTAERKYLNYMDSVEAKINTLKASWESLSQTVLSSDLIVGGVQFLSKLIQGLDKVDSKLGAVPSVLAAISLVVSKRGKGLFGQEGLFTASLNKNGLSGNFLAQHVQRNFLTNKDISLLHQYNEALSQSIADGNTLADAHTKLTAELTKGSAAFQQ